MKKFGALILAIFIISFTLTGCGPRFLREKDILNIENPTGEITLGIFIEGQDEPVLSGTFEFVLFYRDAPNTVANFISLVESGYYTEKSFEEASGNQPFVNFGENEFIDGTEESDDGTPLYYKKPVEAKYHIVGEFYNNTYWDKKGEPRNTQKAVVGSMMMIREINTEDAKKTYNTAYASFRVQTEVAATRKKYEESFCVFGKITKLPDGTSASSADLKSQLVENYFYDSGYSPIFDSAHSSKFMIMSVNINYPEGVTASSFKPRTIKV